MSEKIPTTLSLPPEVRDEYMRYSGDPNTKNKWTVATAAMLAFIESPEEIKNQYMREAAGADIDPPAFDKLVARAKSGQLRKHANELAGIAESLAPSAPQPAAPPGLPPLTADILSRWGAGQVARVVEAIEAMGGPEQAMKRMEGVAGKIGGVPEGMVTELSKWAAVNRMTLEQFLQKIINEQQQIANRYRGKGVARTDPPRPEGKK